MRLLFLAIALVSFEASARDTYVNGYTKSNGTYVEPHYRTAPDHNAFNNYSAQGNVNPYTGHAGTVNPYEQQQKMNTGSNLNDYGFNK